MEDDKKEERKTVWHSFEGGQVGGGGHSCFVSRRHKISWMLALALSGEGMAPSGLCGVGEREVLLRISLSAKFCVTARQSCQQVPQGLSASEHHLAGWRGGVTSLTPSRVRQSPSAVGGARGKKCTFLFGGICWLWR